MEWKKNRLSSCLILAALIFLAAVTVIFHRKAPGPRYTCDDIPRRYVIGVVQSIDKNHRSIQLIYENQPATVTLNQQIVVYDATRETPKTVSLSDLKIGQEIQCDIRLSVTYEKINSFHDCRQIFILADPMEE